MIQILMEAGTSKYVEAVIEYDEDGLPIRQLQEDVDYYLDEPVYDHHMIFPLPQQDDHTAKDSHDHEEVEKARDQRAEDEGGRPDRGRDVNPDDERERDWDERDER